MPKVTPSSVLPSARSCAVSSDSPFCARTTANRISSAATEKISRTRPTRVDSLIPYAANATAASAATRNSATSAPIEVAGIPMPSSRLPP